MNEADGLMEKRVHRVPLEAGPKKGRRLLDVRLGR